MQHALALARKELDLPARRYFQSLAEALAASDAEAVLVTASLPGHVPLALEAIGPGGTHHRLAWGPAFHLGSNWDKPGDEWGAGYVFTAPGCWDLRAIRGNAAADVWIDVIAR